MSQTSESTGLTVNRVDRLLKSATTEQEKLKTQGGAKQHFRVTISSSFDLGYIKFSPFP